MSLREAAEALLNDYDSIEPGDGVIIARWPQMEALRDALAEADRANPMRCDPCGIVFVDKQPGSMCPRCYREVTKAEAEKAEPELSFEEADRMIDDLFEFDPETGIAPATPTTLHEFARAVLAAARRKQCGECHLQPGERCDICGARGKP